MDQLLCIGLLLWGLPRRLRTRQSLRECDKLILGAILVCYGFRSLVALVAVQEMVLIVSLLCFRDAAALCEFWAWLESEIVDGKKMSEVEVADHLEKFRAKQSGFLDTSFETISG
jgi:hypothetical protein